MVIINKHNPCPPGFKYVDGLCVPVDFEKRNILLPTPPSPFPPKPPKPPKPPTPRPPLTPQQEQTIINFSNMVALDAEGVVILAGLVGIENLTKQQIQSILNGETVEGMTYDTETGDVSVDVLLGRPNPDGTRPLIGANDQEIEMIVFDDTQTPAVYRNIETGEEAEQLTPLLEESRALGEVDGAGIEMQTIADAPVVPPDDVDAIMQMNDKELAEWFGKNMDTASAKEMEAYNDRLNQLTDIATGEADMEDVPLTESDILSMDADELAEWRANNFDTATPQEIADYNKRLNQITDETLQPDILSKEEMEALSPEEFRALADVPGQTTQEIIDYNTIVIERAQAANPTVRIFNEMTGKQMPYTEAQIEQMTTQDLNLLLPSFSEEEFEILQQTNPDYLQGLDTEIYTQIQYDQLIADAVEAGADDAELEAMEAGFEAGGIDGAAAAVDLPLTVLAGGAVALAWLDGDKETKTTIAKDAGKTQDFINQEITLAVETTTEAFVETAEEVEEAAETVGKGLKQFGKDVAGLFGGKKKVVREPTLQTNPANLSAKNNPEKPVKPIRGKKGKETFQQPDYGTDGNHEPLN